MSDKVLRNGANHGFWTWQRPCRARPGPWPWNGCKKIAGGGKWGYIGLQPGGKMEIPARMPNGIPASYGWLRTPV